MKRKMICMWRVSKAEPSGLQIWFDPVNESVRLFELPPSEQQCLSRVHELAVEGIEGHLDKDGSVSADEPEPEPERFAQERDEQFGLLEADPDPYAVGG